MPILGSLTLRIARFPPSASGVGLRLTTSGGIGPPCSSKRTANYLNPSLSERAELLLEQRRWTRARLRDCTRLTRASLSRSPWNPPLGRLPQTKKEKGSVR